MKIRRFIKKPRQREAREWHKIRSTYIQGVKEYRCATAPMTSTEPSPNARSGDR